MTDDSKILQVAHGKLIPEYSSAYALRCVRYLSDFKNRLVLSTGGLIFHDEKYNQIKQFRSILMTGMAFLKGNRSLEIYISKGKWVRKKYLNTLFKAVEDSDIIIFEGPWQYYLVMDQLNDKIVVYDAHNVEALLRKGNIWEEYTSKLEAALVQRSDRIITVSEEDGHLLQQLYGKSSDEIYCIPEGFEKPSCTWEGIGSREIVFIGSAYLPNQQAAENVIELARQLPDFTFKIVGSVSSSIKKRGLPENVRLLGILDEKSKEKEICKSFLALNPVTMGSGRNLKMIDYISHGVPVITTEIGSRGFSQEIKGLLLIRDLEGFGNTIKECANNAETFKTISRKMRQYAMENGYDLTRSRAVSLIKSLKK